MLVVVMQVFGLSRDDAQARIEDSRIYWGYFDGVELDENNAFPVTVPANWFTNATNDSGNLLERGEDGRLIGSQARRSQLDQEDNPEIYQRVNRRFRERTNFQGTLDPNNPDHEGLIWLWNDLLDQTLAEERGWLPDTLQWIWGVLQGDFNEDPSTSQIIVRTLITLIPGVDQAADIQDLTAALYKLAWEQRYDEFGPWFDLLTTAIGFVPLGGSAVKGVFKWIKESAGNIDLSGLRRTLEALGAGDSVERFIHEIPLFAQSARLAAHQRIGELIDQKPTFRRLTANRKSVLP
jgi:hypothetical protein